MGCVYHIAGPQGRGYVGITKHTADKRWSAHVKEHKHYTKSALYAAMRKHGVEAFSVVTLETCDDWEALCALERQWIRHLGTKAPGGYNLTDGGEGSSGLGPEATAVKGAKITQALTGKTLTESHCQNLSLSHVGKVPWNKGKRGATEQASTNMTTAATRRWADPVKRTKLETAARNDGRRAKAAESTRRQWDNPEFRLMMSKPASQRGK